MNTTSDFNLFEKHYKPSISQVSFFATITIQADSISFITYFCCRKCIQIIKSFGGFLTARIFFNFC